MLHQKSLLSIISLLSIAIVIKTLLYSNALVCHTPCVLLVYYLLVHIILYIYQPPLYIVNAAVVRNFVKIMSFRENLTIVQLLLTPVMVMPSAALV